jgi:hypothetical protein
MSFGVSVGDVIAVGKLVSDITNSLRDSKSDYQEIVRELENLDNVLRHIDRLHRGGTSSRSLDSIKYAALSCRRPLEQFLGNIRKYENRIGVWGKGGILNRTKDKLKWALGHEDEIRKLQSYLNIHIGTINILLAEYGLEKMDIASDRISQDNFHIRERLEDTKWTMQRVKESAAAQTVAVQTTQSMLTRLLQMVSGEFKTSRQSLGEAVTRVWCVVSCPGSLCNASTLSLFRYRLIIEYTVSRCSRYTVFCSRSRDLWAQWTHAGLFSKYHLP